MNVFLTGGTGTLGAAFTKYVLREKLVERLVVFSRDEWKQAELAETIGHDARVRFMLGDVSLDREGLSRKMRGCDTVVHAAALKRVDAIAYNPEEVHRINIDGVENVCRAAAAAGVSQVIFISSDKAVMPTNVYGVTKAAGEHLTVGANVYGWPMGTHFACVRYGNVLGSRGSVIHRWRGAVAAGRPIVLTHPEMTRFWLTAEDAVRHVLRTREVMLGGEVLLPKLRSAPLWRVAAALTGAESYPAQITGLRPGGEKLHERMLSEEEPLRTFEHKDWYTVAPFPCSWTSGIWAGKPVAPDFAYSSKDAAQFSLEELSELLKEVA